VAGVAVPDGVRGNNGAVPIGPPADGARPAAVRQEVSNMIVSCPVSRALTLALVVAIAAVAIPVLAGEFYEKDRVALRGYDPVAYFKEGRPVKGSSEHRAEHGGAVFHFASKANRDAFAANPASYAPQYGGFCAFGVAGGYKAAIDPAAFTIVKDRLYLNYSKGIQKQWSADIPGMVAKGDRNWPEVSRQTKVIE
jgi:YHS domain-containing protein